MKYHQVISACVGLLISCALGAAEFPQKMEGQRHTIGGRSNSVQAELIQMESPERAKINAVYWDGCVRRGETIAELKEGAWNFTIPGGIKCEDVNVIVRPVNGKNRMEGEFTTGKWNGTIYYEW